VTYAVDKLKKEHNDLSKIIGKRMKDSKGEDKCEVRFNNIFLVVISF
jgi:hypothetical protein